MLYFLSPEREARDPYEQHYSIRAPSDCNHDKAPSLPLGTFLESMPDFTEFAAHYRQPWRPLSRPALIAWLVFYLLFLLYAWDARGGFLIIDNANLIVHEAGHLLFSYLGYTLMIWGGTILQLF